jgi:hypothetical protein
MREGGKSQPVPQLVQPLTGITVLELPVSILWRMRRMQRKNEEEERKRKNEEEERKRKNEEKKGRRRMGRRKEEE